MIWRVAAVLVVLFWAVMSGLLVRDVYFPEASRFAAVPPRMVIDLFLRQSEVFGSTLHLHHHRERKHGRAHCWPPFSLVAGAGWACCASRL